MCQDFIDDRVRGRHSDKGRFVGVYKKFQKLVQFDNVYLLRSGDKKGFRVNRGNAFLEVSTIRTSESGAQFVISAEKNTSLPPKFIL